MTVLTESNIKHKHDINRVHARARTHTHAITLLSSEMDALWPGRNVPTLQFLLTVDICLAHYMALHPGRK
jgi:hypothetical protein